VHGSTDEVYCLPAVLSIITMGIAVQGSSANTKVNPIDGISGPRCIIHYLKGEGVDVE